MIPFFILLCVWLCVILYKTKKDIIFFQSLTFSVFTYCIQYFFAPLKPWFIVRSKIPLNLPLGKGDFGDHSYKN